MSHLSSYDQLRTGSGDPSKLKTLWENLSTELNAYGAGPVKSSGDWQATFRGWKHQIRHKARAIKKHGNETGGGPASAKQLSDVEERALYLWGKEVVGNGLDIGEVGFGCDDIVLPMVEEFVDESLEIVDMPPCSSPSTQSTQQNQSAAKQSPQRKRSAAKQTPKSRGTAEHHMLNMYTKNPMTKLRMRFRA